MVVATTGHLLRGKTTKHRLINSTTLQTQALCLFLFRLASLFSQIYTILPVFVLRLLPFPHLCRRTSYETIYHPRVSVCYQFRRL